MNDIQVRLENRTAHLLGDYPKDLIDSLTSYAVPGAHFNPATRQRHLVKVKENGKTVWAMKAKWDGRKHYLAHDALPIGLWLAIKAKVKAKGFHFKVADERKPLAGLDWARTPEGLRPYQLDALKAMAASLSGGLVLQATGSGKTFLAGAYFRVFTKTVGLFVVDELTLLHQAQQELAAVLGEPVGIVGEGKFDIERVTVATIQTLNRFRRRPKFEQWFATINAAIVDEVHVQMAKRNHDVLLQMKPTVVFGLTATLELGQKPIRTQAWALTGPVVYEYPIEKGVEEEFLAPVCVVQIPFEKSAPKDNYQADYKFFITRSRARNDLVQKVIELALKNNRAVVALVERKKHLMNFDKRFASVPHELVYGKRGSVERRYAKQKFEDGGIRLLLVNKVFQKGVNLKVADTGVDASAMKSRSAALQKLGRFVRLSAGKQYAIYFDIFDMGNRFERAAVNRGKAYKRANIPTLIAPPMYMNGDKWWAEVVDQVERALDKNMRPRQRRIAPEGRSGKRLMLNK